jgi:hypothetical protein
MIRGMHCHRGKAEHVRSANLLLLLLFRATHTIGGPSLDCERSSIAAALTSHKGLNHLSRPTIRPSKELPYSHCILLRERRETRHGSDEHSATTFERIFAADSLQMQQSFTIETISDCSRRQT